MAARVRIVVAESGQDGRDGGAQLARALRDAGLEVIYAGADQSPDQLVGTVIQEDADAVGLCGPHEDSLTALRRITELLAENDARDVVVFGSGISAEDGAAQPEEPGAAKIFTAGATMEDVLDWVRINVVAGTQA